MFLELAPSFITRVPSAVGPHRRTYAVQTPAFARHFRSCGVVVDDHRL